jgi:hypothetical protein
MFNYRHFVVIQWFIMGGDGGRIEGSLNANDDSLFASH